MSSRSARMHEAQWRRLVLVALLPAVTACSSSLKTQGPQGRPTPPAAATSSVQTPPPAPAVRIEDPVVTLIASSDRAFKAGQRELEQGHVEAAKQEFNR